MTTEYTKDPGAALDYGIDWDDWLGTDTIASSSWTVPTGLTQDSDSHDTTGTTVWLSGGTVGQFYLVTNHITTAGGRADERTIRIVVVDR